MCVRVMVIEINHYHTEIFPIYRYYFPKFVGGEIELSYYANYLQVKRLGDNSLRVTPFFNKLISYLIEKAGYREKLIFLRVHWLVWRYRPDVVVLNTLDDPSSQKLCNRLSRKTKLTVGIVHNPAHFTFQTSENCLSLVLNETIYAKYSASVDGYMLPFLPLSRPVNTSHTTLTQKRLTIGITGQVDFARRDYELLLELATCLKKRDNQTVIFNIIGTMNADALREKVNAQNVSSFFVFHDSLDDSQFVAEILKCDYLMPLLSERHKIYYADKMTATYSHAAAYNVPMIIHKENAAAWGLTKQESVVYSGLSDLCDLVSEIDCTETMQIHFSSFVAAKVAANSKFLIGLGNRHRNLF